MGFFNRKWSLTYICSYFQFNQAKMYQYNQAGAFSQCPPGFQPNSPAVVPSVGAPSQWQFNGFQESFGQPNYNYGNNNFNQGASASSAAEQVPWNASHHQHWNNSWNTYYNNGQQPSAEVSASYQRTLEYVQQCQQQSWSANTNNTNSTQ